MLAELPKLVPQKASWLISKGYAFPRMLWEDQRKHEGLHPTFPLAEAWVFSLHIKN